SGSNNVNNLKAAGLSRIAEQPGGLQPAIDSMQAAGASRTEQGHVMPAIQSVGQRPQVLLGRPPPERVEAAQVDGEPIATRGQLPSQAEVRLEVGHGELAQAPVNGRAKAEAGEFAGGHRAPQAAELERP